MPVLSNPRHERFCQELAKGTSQQQAYVLAGFKAHASNPSALARDERILARVAEIQEAALEMAREATEMAAERLSIDREWVMSRLIQNATTAASEGDFAPSNRALELLGKELGMFIDRKHVDIDGELRGVSDAALIALFAGSAEEGDSEADGASLPN
jgi:hypothetical protein